MQFKVPQFLDIEDKIIGPWTFREFVYLAGGAGMCFVIYKLVGLFFGFVPIVLIAGFAIALTYYKPNNKPFINVVQAGVKFAMQDKLYIWKRRQLTEEERKRSAEKLTENVTSRTRSKLNNSKLRDLAWSLDVLDSQKQQRKNQEINNI